MKKFILPILILAFVSCDNKKSSFEYPETKKVDSVDTYFGVEVKDNYRWLEDDMSEETANWVQSQNKVTFDYLEKIPFRKKINDRLTEIWNYEKFSVPFKRGGKYFFFKNTGLQNQSVLYIQDNLNKKEKVLLDPNKLSKDGTVALAGLKLTKDIKYLAYSIARGGSDWNEIFVKEVKTGKILKDHIKWVKFSGISWFKDGFFYSSYDKPEGSALSKKNEFHKVYYHKLGTEQKEDKLIYENKKFPLRNYYVSITDDEKFLIMSETESTHGESVYFKNLEKENSEFVKIADGFKYEYKILEHSKGKFYILTNDNSPKYKLVEVEIKNPEIKNWKEILPEKENVLTTCNIKEGRIIANYMKDAHSKVEIYDLKGNLKTKLKLPTIGTVGGFSYLKGENMAFYTFTSFTVPSIIYKYDFKTGKSVIYKKPKINFDFDNYETKQIFYRSKDGTKVPMFIVHKKGLKMEGNNPTLLYAYGGFNISLTPSFSVTRLAFLENGGVFVMANLRGGGEYGEKWHLDGTKMHKQNVFDDFIYAAEYLIKEKYTSSEKLAIQGGSNGGLLVGAVINQRPELFKVALPAVGVMDMLRYQKFTIGWAWAGDYGTSDDSKEMFEYLKNYSPLHTVKKNGKYPAVLVSTADHDDRVVPAHSFKYIAELQSKNKNNENPLFIRIGVDAGHGAGKPTEKIIEEYSDIWAFLFYNMNIEPYKD